MPPRSRSFPLRHIAPLLALALLAGCVGSTADGPATYEVSGKVTLDGQPLESGEIQMTATDGSSNAAARIENGEYQLQATEGVKQVRISSLQEVPGETTTAAPGEPPVPVKREAIPAKYNEQTELSATVTAEGENEFDFALTSGE